MRDGLAEKIDCFTNCGSPAVGAGVATEDLGATEGQLGLALAQCVSLRRFEL